MGVVTTLFTSPHRGCGTHSRSARTLGTISAWCRATIEEAIVYLERVSTQGDMWYPVVILVRSHNIQTGVVKPRWTTSHDVHRARPVY